jgi:hypothetical protein
MTPPSPELRKLYLRVIRRVHPDGAIDEQDRLRCERLTLEANQAYAAGDEAALRAVLEPKTLRHGWNLSGVGQRRFLAWPNALKVKPWRMAGAIIAFGLVSCYVIIAVKSPKTAQAVQPAIGAQQLRDNTEARTTNITAPDTGTVESSRPPATAHGIRAGGRPSPSHNHPDLSPYLRMVQTQVEKNFDQHPLNAPDGTKADIVVVIRGDGQPGEPHLMMASGYPGVDSACLQSMVEIPTFGPTPTGENVTVNFQCTVSGR